MSIMMVSGFTCVPGSTRMREMVASVSAGIIRILSSRATSVPGPRTCRSNGPRFTVSVQTVARSTSGAAGFNRVTKNATTPSTTTPHPPRINWRRIFFCLISGLEMSIAPGLSANKRPIAATYLSIT